MVKSVHVSDFSPKCERGMVQQTSYMAGFKLKVTVFAESSGNRSAERKYCISEYGIN